MMVLSVCSALYHLEIPQGVVTLVLVEVMHFFTIPQAPLV
jgi:hypothetical protein